MGAKAFEIKPARSRGQGTFSYNVIFNIFTLKVPQKFISWDSRKTKILN